MKCDRSSPQSSATLCTQKSAHLYSSLVLGIPTPFSPIHCGMILQQVRPAPQRSLDNELEEVSLSTPRGEAGVPTAAIYVV